MQSALHCCRARRAVYSLPMRGRIWVVWVLLSLLAGCSAAPRPVQPVRFAPSVPASPVVTRPYHAPGPQTDPPRQAAVTPQNPAVPFERPPAVRPARFEQTGLASWYGPGFHGKKTANGETYNQYAFTAAHRRLPLGTRVQVTNIETGQAVAVRINDRGPFVEGRIIDLSFAAAKRIGVYAPGTAPVRVEVLSAPTPRHAVLYAVQVGSYTDADKAAAMKQTVTQHFSSVYISPSSDGPLRYYHVRLGPFTERDQAEHQARSVARAGLQSIVVEEDDRWAEW